MPFQINTFHATSMTTKPKSVGDVPQTLFGNNLVGWYVADTVVLDGSNNVSQWTDKSGNGNHATQSTISSRPPVVSNAIGGKPAINFNNTYWFSLPNFLQASWGAGSTFIVYTLERKDQQWAAMKVGSAGDAYWGSNSQYSYNGYIGEWRYDRVYAQPQKMTSLGTFGLSIISGTSYTVHRNGTQVLNTTPQWGVTSSPYIGRDETLKRMPGKIAEIVLVSRAATSSERLSMQSYFNSKYGIVFA